MAVYEYTTQDGKKRPVHIVLMEQVLGRPLKDNEVVHHINGDKRDNSLENLQVMDRAEHTRLHMRGISPTKDALEKQRSSRAGKPSPRRLLSREQVRGIAERLKQGLPIKDIAKEFGVSKDPVIKIRDGLSYRDCLDDYPDEAFPLQEKSRHISEEARIAQQKLSVKEATEVKRLIQKGYSDTFIAKQMGIGVTLVRYMRIGRTYQNVPWPEEKRELLHPDTLPDLTFILLKYPMSEKADEFAALRDDYHLTPGILAITMLRLVRRALAGDRDLALCLLVLGGYENMVGRILLEESALAPLMK